MHILKRIMVSILGRIFLFFKSILLLTFYIKLKFYNLYKRNNLKLSIPFNILKKQVRKLFFPVNPHTTMDALMKNKIILDDFISINEKDFFKFNKDTLISMPTNCNNPKEVIVNDIHGQS